MRITVNGLEKEIAAGLCVEELLQQDGVSRDYMALELNKRVLRKKLYAETILHDGDTLEIVKLVGGG